jgi:hypothetical protein
MIVRNGRKINMPMSRFMGEVLPCLTFLDDLGGSHPCPSIGTFDVHY